MLVVQTSAENAATEAATSETRDKRQDWQAFIDNDFGAGGAGFLHTFTKLRLPWRPSYLAKEQEGEKQHCTAMPLEVLSGEVGKLAGAWNATTRQVEVNIPDRHCFPRATLRCSPAMAFPSQPAPRTAWTETTRATLRCSPAMAFRCCRFELLRSRGSACFHRRRGF